ncbi:MAG: PP2C family protein-serine/threonine phosphatase [Micromonosporaceae bacterium]
MSRDTVGAVAVRHALLSHQGLVRGNNEDSGYAGTRLFAVADGVGGAVAGEIASGLAEESLRPLDDAPPDDPVAALRKAMRTANQKIAAAIEKDSGLSGMATTVTAVLFSDGSGGLGAEFGLAHVGDSRAYRYAGDELTQLTRDDTYVQHLVDAGRLTEEEARTHPQRSVVTNVLQGDQPDSATASYTRHTAEPGERYLLCSDGLTDYAELDEITTTLRAERDPKGCAQALVDLALVAGAPDNVTVLVLDITDSR